MKTLIFCTLLLALSGCLPANSTNNDTNQVVSSNPTTEKQEFQAFGNEPFWSVKVSPSEIVYSSLATDEKLTFPYVTPLAADGRFPDTVRVYRLGDEGNTILIIRKSNGCSDTMSDNLHPYSSLFIRGDMVLEGCARKS
ncbi:COG3650 family protein [Anabaena sp. CCY 0017]|uniref:COG3650 family protein n=1 Tax=Anabaena sp. CCY 0017 TaxID=3103866 RepID=UPI0039C5B70C